MKILIVEATANHSLRLSDVPCFNKRCNSFIKDSVSFSPALSIMKSMQRKWLVVSIMSSTRRGKTCYCRRGNKRQHKAGEKAHSRGGGRKDKSFSVEIWTKTHTLYPFSAKEYSTIIPALSSFLIISVVYY